jgi:hypothetical protein
MNPIIDPMAAVIIRSAPSSEAYSALPWSPVLEDERPTRHLLRVRRNLASALQSVASRVQPYEPACPSRRVATSR